MLYLNYIVIIVLFTLDSSQAARVKFTVAIYRDKDYSNYFDDVPNLSEEEAIKIHASGIRYFFSDPKLDPQVDIKFIMRETPFTFEEYGISLDEYLTIFNDFQNEELKLSEEKWNHALLLTGNVSKPDGLTVHNGFCNVSTSSSIVKAKDLHLVPLLATQYIARNMGMEWDPNDVINYIMTQTLSPGIYKWSDLSLKYWSHFVNKNNCLKSGYSEEPNFLDYLPGFRMNLHQQCQAAHGLGFTHQTDKSNSPCKKLVCHNSTVEETLHVASLPGSRCQKFQYCWRGDCQSIGKILYDINEGLVSPNPGKFPGPAFIQAILSNFIKVIRLINFVYNRH